MRTRGAGQVRAGLHYIASVPELWITFSMLLVIGILSYNYSVVLPLFVVKGLNGSDSAYTVLYSAFSAGGLIGALIVARLHTITPRTVGTNAAALGVGLLVLSAAPNVPVAVVIAVFVGGTSIAYMTATTAIAQLRTDRQMLGRVLAVQMVLLIGTTPIGGPILGTLADAVGARAPVVIGGLGALAAAAFGLIASTRLASDDAGTMGTTIDEASG